MNPTDENQEIEKFDLFDGEVTGWCEPGTAIFLKSLSKHGDPVELSAEQARELGLLLLRLAADIT